MKFHLVCIVFVIVVYLSGIILVIVVYLSGVYVQNMLSVLTIKFSFSGLNFTPLISSSPDVNGPGHILQSFKSFFM